jgi:orotate phosphoribosyltransferase
MTPDQVLAEFRKAGALLKGHFILASGLHSDTFLQKALVFQSARRTAKLVKALAAKVRAGVDPLPEVIVAPAVGAIIPGYEMGRALNLPSMFAEREGGGFVLKRGFSLKPGTRVLLVEDIVTTGVSSRECIAAIQAAGGDAVAAACLIDRSGGEADLGVPLIALASLKIPAWPPDAIPEALKKIPAIKPGTRQQAAAPGTA